VKPPFEVPAPRPFSFACGRISGLGLFPELLALGVVMSLSVGRIDPVVPFLALNDSPLRTAVKRPSC
jgi:hypothetical protein